MRNKIHISNSFLVACLIVIGFIVYMLSFQNGLFWDDDDFILKNAYIQDTQYLPKLFSENVIAGAGLVSNYWRPVLLSVFTIEWHLWGAWAPGWHIVNTLFHVGDGVLLFWILKLLELQGYLCLFWLFLQLSRVQIQNDYFLSLCLLIKKCQMPCSHKVHL